MDNLIIPESVAIIMDGNGRWATQRGLARSMGHKEGCKTLERLLYEAGNLGIRYLTVYAFSTENWKRSAEEVGALMDLFRIYFKRIIGEANENNVRVRVIGDRSRFEADIRASIEAMETSTAGNTGTVFVIALNYGGRDEIRRAALKFSERLASGQISGEKETDFSDCLDTVGLKDPDLVIRTSGEQRISNFLLWQAAYAEFVFTPVLWPDFSKQELLRCIEEYNHRKRRFGGV